MKDNTKIIKIENDKEKIDDALFYQQIDAVIYIYKDYSKDYLNNQEQKLKVKYSTNAASSYTKLLLERYFKIADITNDTIKEQDSIIKTINESLESKTKVKINSTLDTDDLSRASYFYDFSNYSILAICIYITAIILIRFNDKKIQDRNNISSKKSSTITKELYLGNLAFILCVWVFIVLLSILILGKVMFTMNGLFLIINSLVFMISALGIGFLIGNIVHSQNAVSAIVNIVALGSSFTCGSFIPREFLPNAVVSISKFLPSYWYIYNNDLIKTIEVFDNKTVITLFTNMGIVLLSAIILFTVTIIYNKHKRKHD